MVVIFYRGYGCINCAKQLTRFAARVSDFHKAGINLVAISTDSVADLKESQAPYQEKGGFPFRLLSDAKLEVFKAYRCLDFDNRPLHGTFLIDAQGRVRWRDISDEPFDDPTFVLKEGKKVINGGGGPVTVSPLAVPTEGIGWADTSPPTRAESRDRHSRPHVRELRRQERNHWDS